MDSEINKSLLRLRESVKRAVGEENLLDCERRRGRTLGNVKLPVRFPVPWDETIEKKGKKMKTVHILGSVMIVVVMVAAMVSLCGIWGLIPGDTAWQVIFSSFVVGGGVVATNEVSKNFFQDKLK